MMTLSCLSFIVAEGREIKKDGEVTMEKTFLSNENFNDERFPWHMSPPEAYGAYRFLISF
jgi:hypothetical protein